MDELTRTTQRWITDPELNPTVSCHPVAPNKFVETKAPNFLNTSIEQMLPYWKSKLAFFNTLGH